MDWIDGAACVDVDPELFYPVGDGLLAQEQIIQAKSVCRRCPVVAECLNWALNRSEFGVWGGMSEDERRAHRRETAPPPRVVSVPEFPVTHRLCTGCDLTRSVSDFSPTHTRCRACRNRTERARKQRVAVVGSAVSG